MNLRAIDWVREAAQRPAARVRDPDRLRPRSARPLCAAAFGGHADDLLRTSRAARSGRRRRVAAESGRPGHHRARRLHERAGRPPKRKGCTRSDCSTRPTSCMGLLTAGRVGADAVPSSSATLPIADERLALKTLLMPGGLGSTMKVLILGKGVGRPALAGLLVTGCGSRERRRRWPVSAIMIGSEAATLATIEPFCSWNTPICWTGFILFADASSVARRRQSWIRSAPARVRAAGGRCRSRSGSSSSSTTCSCNWNYTGLPGSWWLRMLGYAWAFATIWPAIFEGAELVVWCGGPCVSRDVRRHGRTPG